MKKTLSLALMLICFTICEAQTIENPVFDRTDTPAFRVEKVKFAKDTTYLYCSYKADTGSWANLSADTYIQDQNTKKKYPILRCEGLPFAPIKRFFHFDEKCDVVVYFPSFKPHGKFDLIENPQELSFNIFGIDVNSQFKMQYSESELKRFTNMASFYESSGDTIKAIQYKKDELQATHYLYGEASEAYLVSLQGLGFLYNKFGFHIEAIKQMENALILQKTVWGDSDWLYALQLTNLAQIYSNAHKYDLSLKNYKDAIALYEKINITDNEYALALSFTSDVYNDIGDESQAILYQKKAIDARRAIGESDKYLNDLMMMLNGRESKNRITIVENELCNLPEFVDTTSFSYTDLLKALIINLEINDDNAKAIKYCDRCLFMLQKEKSDNLIRIAEIEGYKCRNLRRLGLIHESIVWGERAKIIMDSIQVKPCVYNMVLEEIASNYADLYDYESAIQYMEQNVKLYEENEDWVSLAGALQNIGSYYQYKEELDKAEEFINKAIDIIYSHDDAEEIFKEEMERRGDANNQSLSPQNLYPLYSLINSTKYGCLHALGNNYIKKGNYDEAIKLLRKCGELMKTCGEEVLYLSNLVSLSQYYTNNNQLNEAITASKECINIFYSLEGSIKETGILDDFMVATYGNLGHCYYKLNKKEQAKEYLLKAIGFSVTTPNVELISYLRLFLSSIYKEDKDYNKAERCLSSALENAQNSIMNEISSMKTSQKQRLWSRYELFFNIYRELIEEKEWNNESNTRLYDYTLFSKSLLIDSYKTNNEELYTRMSISWKDIQMELSDHDIAIEFISTAEDSLYSTYHALIIDKTCRYPNMITLYHESDFQKIKQNSNKTVLDIVGELIWKPIISQYPQIENIYFSPDGILHRLPIEYSNVEGIGEMMEHYNLYRLSSTKDILFHNQSFSNNNAILYGGLDYDGLADESNLTTDSSNNSLLRSINARGGFDPLYSTLEEVKEIGGLLGDKHVSTTLYTGENGTEDSFKALSGKDVNILHISTHGMYVGPSKVEQKRRENNFDFLKIITNEKDPVIEDIVLTHSFLVMSGGNKLSHRETQGVGSSDGILTAFEISYTDLSKVDLVVLSACETGLGDLDSGGIYGLQRGFKKAGANTILMSLDKVDDEATKILMVEFYKNLMCGKNKHQSLKDAQKHLRQVDNGKYNKPEYWASFIMLDGLN